MADDNSVEVPVKVKTSDLGVRTASAVVMLAVAGGVLWLGGWPWRIFAALVAAGVLWEWRRLVQAFAAGPAALAAWNIAGILYIGLAAATLMALREGANGFLNVLTVVAMVIATDVGAYFAGRTIGGPKIAPKISPSKTWAGLGGGALLSGLTLVGIFLAGLNDRPYEVLALPLFGIGILAAIVAQAGDFFESWMKRKAGVKDSGNLIPGHGGLFDRVDGLLAVAFVIGLVMLLQAVAS